MEKSARMAQSIICEAIDFECPICYQLYDEEKKYPMMICPNQHTCCLNCLDAIFRGRHRDQLVECSFCKVPLARGDAVRFRLLNDIRITAKTLKTQGNRIKQDMNGLKQEKGSLQKQLADEKTKNEWLIQQIGQNRIIAMSEALGIKLSKVIEEQQTSPSVNQLMVTIQWQNKRIRQLQQTNKEQQIRIQELQKLYCSKQLPLKKENDKPKLQLIPQEVIDYLKKNKGEEKIELGKRGLFAVDVTQHYRLKVLDLFDNQLAKVNLRSNSHLTYLYLHNNQLEEIDLTHNRHLKELYLSGNNLTKIDLSFNTQLIQLQSSKNRLCSIDLKNNKKLKKIDLSHNQLSQIDLSKCPQIEILRLNDNNLQKAVFWWHSKLYDVQLHNQQSSECKLIFRCRRGETEKCSIWATKKMEYYNKKVEDWQGNYINRYKCTYSSKVKQNI